MTFDGWETQFGGGPAALSPGGRLSESELMHWGIPGMKHGRRRFQNEDGSWTPLGLKERRAREGFGEGREARKAARAERKAIKAEARSARKAARAERITAAKEQRRKNNLKTMTDDELKAKISRMNMEKQYKELSRSPLLDFGMKVVDNYLGYKERKEQRVLEMNKQKLENKRLDVQKIQALETTKQAAKAAKRAKFDAKAEESKFKAVDVEARKGGLKLKRKTELKNAKTNYRSTTIWGSLGKRAQNRAKYKQEMRMDPIEARKHARTVELTQLQIKRDKLKAKNGSK